MLLLFLACSTPPASQAPPALIPVKLGLNWYPEPEFGGFYEALLSGAYEKSGLKVEILPGGPGVPTLEMLQSQQVQVAISGADDLLVKRAKGLTAKAVFPGFQDSPLGLMTHVPGPTSYEEVKGKVAIEQGSPFQQFLSKKYAWEGKVELLPSSGSVGPFAADPTLVQQGYITSEPCQAERMQLQVAFLPARDAGWNPYASLAVVAESEVGKPWVKAFVDASKAGWLDYLKDPSRADAEIARLNPNMPLEQMGCITSKQKPFVEGKDGVGVMTAERWNEVASTLNSVGLEVRAEGAWSGF